jgi:hypothetical protein
VATLPWTDVATALAAIVGTPLALMALFQTRLAIQSQTASSDLQIVVAIWEKLDTHWARFRQACSEEQHFEFGQLTGYYEFSCQLFRDNLLTTSAASTLKEHLVDILPLMQADQKFKALFAQLQSDDRTFENIRWFCKHHVNDSCKKNRFGLLPSADG